jgi:hypothetical protein
VRVGLSLGKGRIQCSRWHVKSELMRSIRDGANLTSHAHRWSIEATAVNKAAMVDLGKFQDARNLAYRNGGCFAARAARWASVFA